jgi:glycosyltransferase involved in cell wall biosynthesis
MRILLISHTCQSLLEGLPKAQCLGRYPGVELCVLVPDRWRAYGTWRFAQTSVDPPYRHEVHRPRLPWTGPGQTFLHHYPRLKQLLREFQPDVIDLWEEPWSAVSAHACRLRNRLCPSAVVISETEQNIEKRLPLPFEWFRRYTFTNAQHLVGRSREAVEVAHRRGYKGPATVVPNAVDVDLFRPRPPLGSRERPKMFTLGYVGRLTPEKGVDDVIEAIGCCVSAVRLIVVGDGPDAPRLRALVDRLNLSERVHVLGRKPLDTMPDVLSGLDALVLASRTTRAWKEQFGRVIIEAHACGVPVIGSDSGAIPDVVGDGGLIFREGDPAALAAAIDQLAADPDAADRMGQWAAARARAEFSWQAVADRMVAIYEAALLTRRGGAAHNTHVGLAYDKAETPS